MQFCANALPEDDNDARAHVLVLAQRLVEQATELNKRGPQVGSPSTQLQIESLIKQLDTIKQNLSLTIASHRTYALHVDSTMHCRLGHRISLC